jgi:hypothetical protein
VSSTVPDLGATPLAHELAGAGVALGRRRFLRALGLAVTSAWLPVACDHVAPALAPPSGVTLAVLTPRTYGVLTAAAMRIVGPRGAGLIADRSIDVGRLGDAWLARTPAIAAPIGQALLLLELGVWPLVGKVRPFTALAPDGQDAILRECMASRLETKRAVFRGVRSLALLTFYGSPASRPLTGFPGPFGTDTVTIADAMRD